VSSPLHEFARRRHEAGEVLERLATAVSALGGDTGHSVPQLRAGAERARSGRFHVLLLGCFSSGKSTLLNALMGQPVLPVKVNPCTAILTELVYADQPSVQVRFNDGQDPADLSLDGFLEQYQLSTAELSEAGVEASDRFGNVDRAVVSYPLPLLQDGVVLLDTPGLDDDPSRTARTLSTLPDADAVIVVLNATRFLTELERRTLRSELHPLGLTNLFFPTTMVDLLDALTDHPERELADLVTRGREVLGPLCESDGTDRFDERFFPLDARGALLSRWDRKTGERRDPPDAAALKQSGIEPFEHALESFLVNERGRAQMEHLVGVAVRTRDELDRQAQLDRATADASVDELRERIAALEPQFAELETIARRVGQAVDASIARLQQLVWQDLRDFLARTEEQLPDALEGFDLGGLAGVSLLTPAGRERVEIELREELEAWLATRAAGWQKTLRARLERSLQDLHDEIVAETGDFDAVVDGIVADFAGGAVVLPKTNTEQDVDPGERWFSVAMGAVLLSPGAVAAGWSQGYEGAMKGLVSRLGVRLAVVALGALLGPIGWAGILLYVLSDAALLMTTGGGQLRRAKAEVARNLQGKLVAQADAQREEVLANVAEGMAPLRAALVGAAASEATELKSLLQRTIAERESAAVSAAERATAWESALETVVAGVAELKALAKL